MPPHSSADTSFGVDRLRALLQEVVSSREAMTVARRAPLGVTNVVQVTRIRLLHALEAYAAELEARHLPVPYVIRDDLRLQRRTLGRPASASG